MSLNVFLDRLSNNIFSHPYASAGKNADGVFAPARKVSKKYALGMPVIQLNGPRQKRFLSFDIDRPLGALAWEDANLPIPNLIITNPHNGHAHLVWELHTPIWEAKKGDERSGTALPIRYLKATYRAMREALGADTAYNGLLVKNPFHPSWTVTCGRSKPYSLGELSAHLDLSSEPSKAKLPETQVGYRNCQLFDSVRFWAYRAKRLFSSIGLFRSAIDDELDRLNGSLDNPLSFREVDGIAKSVSTWVWNTYTGSGNVKCKGICQLDSSIPLLKRQQLGQSAAANQRILMTRLRIRRAIASIGKGIRLTKAEVARRAGLDRKTVYRHWNDIVDLTGNLLLGVSDSETVTLTVTERETVSLRDKLSKPPAGVAAQEGRERYPDRHSMGHSHKHPVIQAILDRVKEAKPSPEYPKAAKTSIQDIRAYLDRLYEKRTIRRPV